MYSPIVTSPKSNCNIYTENYNSIIHQFTISHLKEMRDLIIIPPILTNVLKAVMTVLQKDETHI